MREILESDWTLGAVKRREEERLKSEGAARQGDAETIQAPHAPDMSGDRWVAEAFRRRQEEERAKAASRQPSGGDRAGAASGEIPVDNWLIEGFKRHQEEERRREIISRSDEAGALAVADDESNFDTKSSPSRAHAARDEIGLSEEGGSANRQAGANDEASALVVGALVSRGGETALYRRPSGAARIIAIAGIVVLGLVSVVGLKTALWSSVESPRGFDQGAPSAAPPPKSSAAQPPKAGAAQPPKAGAAAPTTEARPATRENVHPDTPPTRPAGNGGAPASESTARPGDAAPAKPGDAAKISAPAAEAPQHSMQNPATPRPQPEPKAPSSSSEQGGKSLQENAAAPAASAPAPVPAGPKEAVSPARPDKDSTAKPASVESERSHEGGGPEPGQNASEPKRQAPNADVDAKPKQQAKEKGGARHSSRKSDGFSAFLKRTANSVRRFFGRLGERQ